MVRSRAGGCLRDGAVGAMSGGAPGKASSAESAVKTFWAEVGGARQSVAMTPRSAKLNLQKVHKRLNDGLQRESHRLYAMKVQPHPDAFEQFHELSDLPNRKSSMAVSLPLRGGADKRSVRAVQGGRCCWADDRRRTRNYHVRRVSLGLRCRAQADKIRSNDDDDNAGPEQTDGPALNACPFTEREANERAAEDVAAHVEHPVDIGDARRDVGFAPGVEEELEVPHDSAGCSHGAVFEEHAARLRKVGTEREIAFEPEPQKAIAHVDDGAAAHDEHVAGQARVERIDADGERGGADGSGGIEAEGKSRRENSA